MVVLGNVAFMAAVTACSVGRLLPNGKSGDRCEDSGDFRVSIIVRYNYVSQENGGCALYSMSNLGKLKILDANASAAMQAFWAFDKAAMADGAIPVKYKELMALAVAFTTQCPYCIEIHSGKARQAGATDPEIAEVVTIAAALRAGAAITHGTHAFPGA
jgi:AhpD family alkylhydroperoxidase